MEHHVDIAVMPHLGACSDVCSWNSVAELSPADVDVDVDGNSLEGQAASRCASNTFVHVPHLPEVALGTKDLHIVDTPDAALVVHRKVARP